MGKKWMRGRFWVSGTMVKKNPVDPDYNLEKFGCIPVDKKDPKKILELFIRRGIPCQKHNALYLKFNKITDSFNY